MELLGTIPSDHTVAIIKGEEIYYSGMMKDSKAKWESLPFDTGHGIYQYIMKAINGKWYRHTWMQF